MFYNFICPLCEPKEYESNFLFIGIDLQGILTLETIDMKDLRLLD